jgi:hypothetical protein
VIALDLRKGADARPETVIAETTDVIRARPSLATVSRSITSTT